MNFISFFRFLFLLFFFFACSSQAKKDVLDLTKDSQTEGEVSQTPETLSQDSSTLPDETTNKGSLPLVKNSSNFALLTSYKINTMPPEVNTIDDFVYIPSNDSTASFFISPHEVTQKEFHSIMGYIPCESAGPKKDNSTEDGNKPVVFVSWAEILAYVNLLSLERNLEPVYLGLDKEISNIPTVSATANGYRLPDEREWMYAAYGGEPSLYSGSNAWDKVGWFNPKEESVPGVLHSVAEKAPNAIQLYDMSGNVSELVWEYQFISGAPLSFATYGGSFLDESQKLLESRHVMELVNYETSRVSDVGFRLVRSALPETVFPLDIESRERELMSFLPKPSTLDEKEFLDPILESTPPQVNEMGLGVHTYYVKESVSQDNRKSVSFHVDTPLPKEAYGKERLIYVIYNDYNRLFYPDSSSNSRKHWKWQDWRIFNTFLYESGLASLFYNDRKQIVSKPYKLSESVKMSEEIGYMTYEYVFSQK